MKLSIVIPIMNEEGNIENLVKRTSDALKVYNSWEMIFIDDGSTDNTINIIKEIAKMNQKIKFISFSRNFGHQNALRAGLDFADGDCIISMDGDLQHPPELLPKLIKKWQEGFEVVYTLRQDDPKTPFLKRKTANIFYVLMSKFSDIKIKPGAADFRLLDRKVVDAVKNIKEADLFMRGMVLWLGFKQIAVEYMPEKRQWGKTKYTFKKMLRFAVAGITGFSIKPLHISTILGCLMASFSFLYGSYAIYVKVNTNETVLGWTSILASIFFIGGVQMIILGILGEYLGKLFMESKKRPNYIIREKNI